MEPSKSDSASVPNGSDQLMGAAASSQSPTSHHDPRPSDLDRTAQDAALCTELQRMVDLKGEGEEGAQTAHKDSNFNEAGEEGVKGHDDESVNGGDDVGVKGGDGGVKSGGEDGVKGDEDGAKVGDEGVKGDDDVGVNGVDDVGAKVDGERVKGDDVGVKGDEEGVKVGDEGVKGDDEGANGYDEGVKRYYEGANGYEEGVKDGDGDGDGDRDSRSWEINSWDENVNEGVNVDNVIGGHFHGGVVDGVEEDDDDVDGLEKREERRVGGGGGIHQYPWRPEAPDCAFYMKTGTCKFGLNCKFNHPIRRKNQALKELAGEREEPAERPGQTECKYYLRSGGCKFGKDCKYNHTRVKDSTPPIAELNFLGLPIRPGKRECPYYMRNGSCKFGANCKFNHPDPTTVGGGDPPSGYGNGGSISVHGVSQQSVSTWSSPRTINETSPFVPMMLSPTQGVSPQGSDWNGYQAPVYLPERSMHPPATYVMNNPAIETNAFMHQQQQMQVDEFPERPGEPECSFFLKTGDCKFKSNCKFHHPKNRVTKLPPCNLNDKGLPLRPDKNACSHYTRYGICKFGPACKFDHPNSLPSLDHQPYTDSASGMGGTGGASDPTIQQSL